MVSSSASALDEDRAVLEAEPQRDGAAGAESILLADLGQRAA